MPHIHILFQKLTLISILAYIISGLNGSIHLVVLTNAILAHLYIVTNKSAVDLYAREEWGVRSDYVMLAHGVLHFLPLLVSPRTKPCPKELLMLASFIVIYSTFVDLSQVYPMFDISLSRARFDYAMVFLIATFVCTRHS